MKAEKKEARDKSEKRVLSVGHAQVGLREHLFYPVACHACCTRLTAVVLAQGLALKQQLESDFSAEYLRLVQQPELVAKQSAQRHFLVPDLCVEWLPQ
ncbi:hypothetical protein EBX31_10320 [bacterium]|nr:hypothetical protein [bacterium]